MRQDQVAASSQVPVDKKGEREDLNASEPPDTPDILEKLNGFNSIEKTIYDVMFKSSFPICGRRDNVDMHFKNKQIITGAKIPFCGFTKYDLAGDNLPRATLLDINEEWVLLKINWDYFSGQLENLTEPIDAIYLKRKDFSTPVSLKFGHSIVPLPGAKARIFEKNLELHSTFCSEEANHKIVLPDVSEPTIELHIPPIDLDQCST